MGNVSTAINVRANGANAIVVALPFNENTGTTATNLGTLGGVATTLGAGFTWQPGKFGSGVQVNTTGGLSIANAGPLNVSTFTLSAYVKPALNMTDFRNVLIKNPPGADGSYWLYGSESAAAGAALRAMLSVVIIQSKVALLTGPLALRRHYRPVSGAGSLLLMTVSTSGSI